VGPFNSEVYPIFNRTNYKRVARLGKEQSTSTNSEALKKRRHGISKPATYRLIGWEKENANRGQTHFRGGRSFLYGRLGNPIFC